MHRHLAMCSGLSDLTRNYHTGEDHGLWACLCFGGVCGVVNGDALPCVSSDSLSLLNLERGTKHWLNVRIRQFGIGNV